MNKNFESIFMALKENVKGVGVQKAYTCVVENLDFSEPKVTIEMCADNLLVDLLQIEVDIFILKSMGMKGAEQVFLKISDEIQKSGFAIEKISRGAVLSDDEIGMIMVPCIITVKTAETSLNNINFTVNGIKSRAEKMEITVSRLNKELYSFGEDVPFDVLPQKTNYQIKLKGVEVNNISELKNFSFIPEDESGYAYFGCEWVKYSVSKKEISLISSDRRKLK